MGGDPDLVGQNHKFISLCPGNAIRQDADLDRGVGAVGGRELQPAIEPSQRIPDLLGDRQKVGRSGQIGPDMGTPAPDGSRPVGT